MTQYGTVLEYPMDMDMAIRYWIFIFLLGSLVLSSCHPVPFQKTASDKKTLIPSEKIQTLSVAKKIDGLQLKTLGPNCWNGALVKAGLIHSVRFVSKGEYWFWMNSPYCRKLNSSEKPQRGDLGSLFWPDRGHYHSFVFLDSKWVFSKNSPDPKYRYEVQRFEDMFYMHYKNKAQKCWQDFQSRSQENCEFDVQFHQCRPVEEGFYKTDSKVVAWDAKIKLLEEKVFLWVSGKANTRLETFERTIGDLYDIWREVQIESKNEFSKTRKFKLEALEFRLIGLMLSDVEIAQSSKKLNPILNQIYKLQLSKSPQLSLSSQKNSKLFEKY